VDPDGLLGDPVVDPPAPGPGQPRPRKASKYCRDWGLFHFNFREPTSSCKMGAWSTVCVAHSTTLEKCTKSLNSTKQMSMRDGIYKMACWANQATLFATKADHMSLDPKKLPILTAEELRAGKLTRGDILAAGLGSLL
jgi:hypothetical protein